MRLMFGYADNKNKNYNSFFFLFSSSLIVLFSYHSEIISEKFPQDFGNWIQSLILRSMSSEKCKRRSVFRLRN